MVLVVTKVIVRDASIFLPKQKIGILFDLSPGVAIDDWKMYPDHY